MADRSKSLKSDFTSITAKPRFPEKVEYIIGPKKGLEIIHQALANNKNFREDRLYIFRTIIGPLVPETIRNKLEKLHLNEASISYQSLINGIGNFVSSLILFRLEDDIATGNYCFIILPYLELKFQKKIEQLEQKKPFGWKIARKFYQRNLSDIAPLVDNLINLVTLAWTFCPAIGEPEQETGFFNRFVFTSNGGFIDLGHFFNCAVISYLYGADQAVHRAEATEIQQRKLREKQWLVKLRERNYLRLVTNLLWGYATSTDTIEDRASNKLGIELGKHIRNFKDNQKLIKYYIDFYPKMIRRSIRFFARHFWLSQLIDVVGLLFKNLFYTSHQSGVFDIEQYMKNFFDEYDGIEPNDPSVVPPELFKNVISFYTEKYFGKEWDNYTCPDWQAVIPQDLWEQVVKGRKQFEPKLVPIKIQLKATGERVDPY